MAVFRLYLGVKREFMYLNLKMQSLTRSFLWFRLEIQIKATSGLHSTQFIAKCPGIIASKLSLLARWSKKKSDDFHLRVDTKAFYRRLVLSYIIQLRVEHRKQRIIAQHKDCSPLVASISKCFLQNAAFHYYVNFVSSAENMKLTFK